MTRPKGLAGIEQAEPQATDGQGLQGEILGGPPAGNPPVAERIEPSELAYFQKVAAGLARAGELEQQAAAARQQAIALRGAYDSWASHLVERYALDPERDQIDPQDGVIQRASAMTNGLATNGTDGS